MSTTIRERDIQRSAGTIYAEIEEQHEIVTAHLNLAVGYYNVDVRPLLCDGLTVHRLGPDPVPQELRDTLSDEQRRLTELTIELREAMRAERSRHSSFT